MNKKILIGSRAFFSKCPNFNSKDIDYLILVNKGNGFQFVRQLSFPHQCIFEFVRRPKQEMIDYALQHGAAMQVGKFLVKEFAEEIGLTIDDLKQLQPLVDKLDSKHAYERIIFDFITENGSWDIPDEVRNAAYDVYRAARPDTNKHENTAHQQYTPHPSDACKI